MRAALLVSDVLREEGAAAALSPLAAAGLRPVVVAVDGSAGDLPAGLEAPVVSSPVGRPGCWDDSRGLLAAAAARAGARPDDAFVLCTEGVDVAAAAEAGCRPVLVVGNRTLDDVYGPVEPRHKNACAVRDLATAVRCVVEESGQDKAVGPFPYSERVAVEGRARLLAPAPRDLATLLSLVTLAGVAIALGIAYLLQEVYQRATLPAAAYWITLQFIPQALRGLLFLAFGGAVGMMVRPYLSRLSDRYRARRV